jgi:Zn-dependent protease with chaperone function
MSFAVLALTLFLVAYAGAVVLGTALAVPLFRAAARCAEPAKRARLLAASRLIPSGLAAAISLGLVLPAFLGYEPRDTVERVTAPMLGLAAAGLLLLMAGPVRGWRSIRRTRRLVERWAREGTPVDLPGAALPVFAVDERFPLVAMVGWFHPRVVIARSVLAIFDRQELAAVLAHERAHHERRDPWVALLHRACPDLLSMTPWAQALESAWLEAAEEDADQRASDSGPSRALDLASALVKVARLAEAGPGPRVLGFALYHGDGIAGRIGRLLERPDERDSGGAGRLLFAAAGAAFLGVAFFHLQAVHRLLEALVSALQ